MDSPNPIQNNPPSDKSSTIILPFDSREIFRNSDPLVMDFVFEDGELPIHRHAVAVFINDFNELAVKDLPQTHLGHGPDREPDDGTAPTRPDFKRAIEPKQQSNSHPSSQGEGTSSKGKPSQEGTTDKVVRMGAIEHSNTRKSRLGVSADMTSQSMHHNQSQQPTADFLARLYSIDRMKTRNRQLPLPPPQVTIQAPIMLYVPPSPARWPPRMIVDYVPQAPPSPYLMDGLPDWRLQVDQFYKSFKSLDDRIPMMEAVLEKNSFLERNGLWEILKPEVNLSSALYYQSAINVGLPPHVFHHEARQRFNHQGYRNQPFQQHPHQQQPFQQQVPHQQGFQQPLFRKPLSPMHKPLGLITPVQGLHSYNQNQNHSMEPEPSTTKNGSRCRKRKGEMSLLDARIAKQRAGVRKSLRFGESRVTTRSDVGV